MGPLAYAFCIRKHTQLAKLKIKYVILFACVECLSSTKLLINLFALFKHLCQYKAVSPKIIESDPQNSVKKVIRPDYCPGISGIPSENLGCSVKIKP